MKAKLNLKDFDFKRFLIQKGERVGLIVAGAIMILLVLSACIGMVGGTSAGANTEELKNKIAAASQSMTGSKPTDGMGELPGDLREVRMRWVDRNWFPCENLFFAGSGDIDRKWRQPPVLAPDDFVANVVQGPVPSYVLLEDPDDIKIGILIAKNLKQTEEAKEKLKKTFENYKKSMRFDRNFPQQMAGGAPPSGGMGGKGGGLGGLMKGMRQMQEKTDDEMELKFVKLDAPEVSGKLAQTVIPLRMVVVTGAFPYKQQLEEFRKALRFDSINDLLADNEAHPEFAGFKIQRITIKPTGEVASEWIDLDVEKTVKDVRVRAMATEPEESTLKVYGIIVQPNHLVMPRPKLAHDEKYPDENLASIKAALAALEKAHQGNAPPLPKKTNILDKDPWSESDESSLTKNLPPAAGTGGAPGGVAGPGLGAGGSQDWKKSGGRMRFGNKGNNPGSPAPIALKDYIPPEKCLLRFIDVTVQPGYTYEYRVKVLMANPNYQRPERAAAETFTKAEFLEPEEWTVLTQSGRPLQVSVPDELRYYAVDEKTDSRVIPANSERVAVQIHRWLDVARVNPTDKESVVPVGDWTILERETVHRGEYIGRTEEVAVPVWKTSIDGYSLALRPEDRVKNRGRTFNIKHKGLAIDFATDPVQNKASILVDFEGGKRTFSLEGKNTAEDTPVEMLVIDASGKLLVHNGKADTEDKTRIDRYSAWKKWVDEVRQGDKNNKKKDSLFDKPGGPAQ